MISMKSVECDVRPIAQTIAKTYSDEVLYKVMVIASHHIVDELTIPIVTAIRADKTHINQLKE